MPRPHHSVPQGWLHRSKPFEVPGLLGKYPLTVYLPPGFREGGDRHPVAYVFDGQNIFGHEGSYAGGWHMHEALDKLAAHGKRVPIVVGIHHGGASRAQDMTPWALKKGDVAKGNEMLDWVVGPLAAMVAEEMPILTGPEHTLIGGSSLGGLMALYGFCRHPEFFGRCLSMSPSLWVGRGAIFQVVHQARMHPSAKVYLDYGGREMGGQGLKTAAKLADLFAAKGLVQGKSLMWRPDAKGAHNELNWRRRLPKALRYMYGGEQG